MSTYLTVKEVTQILKVSKSYVYDLITRGELKAIRLSERRIRILEESMEEFTRREREDFRYNIIVQPPKKGRKPNGKFNK